MQKSYVALPGKLQKTWYHVDGQDLILGRLAVRIATILMGKHKPTYTPNVDTGDFVIVTNARGIKVTGKKAKQKIYYSWSGYPGGLKKTTYEELFSKSPQKVLKLVVRRMLPKNRLGRKMLKKLKVYEGPEHPHQAQNPQTLEL